MLSEVDSDRRAARGSRVWPLAGSGARAGSSGPGARAQPASRLTMSHGHWNKFLSFSRQPFKANSASHPCIRREILDACMQ
eukprot:COSAG05_NODE_7064_length_861_cov_0.961942_2_plen_80_part_01